MNGFIHSIESMGLVDGPGIRTVVFLSGCKLRCRFCHNPDTWAAGQGEETSPEQLLQKLRRFQTYYRASGGGVTFSGGEPLMQPGFLNETLRLCKEAGIHTCLDTAGVSDADEGTLAGILANTSLVLFDVKDYRPDGYQALTGQPIGASEGFIALAERMGVPIWVRQVVVPGLNDSDGYMQGLQEYVGKIRGVQRVELLPYHLLGVHKYAAMGIPYSLEGVPAMDAARCQAMQEKYFPAST